MGKREEIDMAELNALLNLDDDRFENKFEELIGSPSKSVQPTMNLEPTYQATSEMTAVPSSQALNN